MKNLFFILAALFLSQTMLQAQSYLAPEPLREKEFFVITDFAYTLPFNSIDLSRYSKRGDVFNSEFGLMGNLSNQFAVGATIHFAFSDGHPNTYIKLRARKWLSDKMSIDLAPGIEVNSKKFMASVDVHFNKWFALTTQIEPVKTFNGFKYPISGGIKLSSTPGLVTNLIGIIGTAIVFASWDGL